MSVDLAALHPLLAERWLQLKEEYERKYAPELLIATSGLRRDSQQIALYAQGRRPLYEVNALRKVAGYAPITAAENEEERDIVTFADGIRKRSDHQGVLYEGRLVAVALDVAPALDPDGPGPGKPVIPWKDIPRFERIGPLAKLVGLDWGGNWTPRKRDLPHVYLPPVLVAATTRSAA